MPPCFRIQNPWTQTLRYDPGDLIKHWLPELKERARRASARLRRTAVPLVPGYPLPIVDHSTERDRCLAMFAQHKERIGK